MCKRFVGSRRDDEGAHQEGLLLEGNIDVTPPNVIPTKNQNIKYCQQKKRPSKVSSKRAALRGGLLDDAFVLGRAARLGIAQSGVGTS